MTNKQPNALRLAGLLELAPEDGVEPQTAEDAAAELRRLHTRIAELEARIKTMAEEHADELMVAHLDGRMRAAKPAGAQQPGVATWMPLPGVLPEPGKPVLLDIGKEYPIRAMWAAKFTLPVDLEDDSGFGEHDGLTDEWYCPEGWYEWNEQEERHWFVDKTPVAWCELSPNGGAPHRQAPAQPAPELTETAVTAKNPAAPVSSFEDSRTQAVYEVLVNDNYPPAGSNEHWEGWKARLIVDALFPIEAPAAVAGQSEFPHEQTDVMALARYKVMPSHESMLHRHVVVAGDGSQQLYIGREVECENMARKFAGAFLDGAFAFHSMLAAAPTPPTQAAESVTAPASGANWQDISTAPKDGTRFVAVGQNYGLDSEKQHTCIAQWLAGCWVEVSDWNGASKLKHLTHWMPLPPLPGSAARAPADSVTASSWASHEKELEDALRERDESDEFIDTLLDEVLGADRAEWSSAYGRADALNDVQERMTTLHKPTVDKAWGRFQVAMAADSVLEDAARLDWLDEDGEDHVSKVGKTWYTRPAYGRPYRKHKNLRDAIDAARKQGANHD